MKRRTARIQRLALGFAILTAVVAAVGCTNGGAQARRGSLPEAARGASAPAADASVTPAPPVEPGHAARANALARDAAEIARGPSITAVGGYMRIFDAPDRRAQVIGLAHAGQSVPLASATQLVVGPDGRAVASCDGGWYAVEPRGFACAGEFSTLDGNDPRALAAREALPDVGRVLPFDVGTAVGSPMYTRIPTPAEQRREEPGLETYLKDLRAAGRPLGAVDLAPAQEGPSDALRDYFAASRSPLVGDKAYTGRSLAWSRSFDAEGRTWLETPDLLLIPKDKVRPTTGSTLDGVDLVASPEMALPLAYTLDKSPQLTERKPALSGRSTLVETGTEYARHAFLPIEGERIAIGGRAYWKTRDGFFVAAERVNVFTQRKKLPYTVRPGAKWIDVRVLGGTLVAYEGERPVYAAAISPGRDGVTVRPRSHATLPGLYQVQWKHYSADMSGREGNRPWAVDEVPFVAYFFESYALHSAHWHDEFGRPRSHGCVNLSPRSAQWLFRWMDPDVPRGWYAVAGFGRGVPITVVDVRP